MEEDVKIRRKKMLDYLKQQPPLVLVASYLGALHQVFPDATNDEILHIAYVSQLLVNKKVSKMKADGKARK